MVLRTVRKCAFEARKRIALVFKRRQRRRPLPIVIEMKPRKADFVERAVQVVKRPRNDQPPLLSLNGLQDFRDVKKSLEELRTMALNMKAVHQGRELIIISDSE